MFIIFATIQNKDKYCYDTVEYSPEYPQRYCMLKKYAESITCQTQSQQETTDGHINNVIQPASCSHPFSYACGVVHASPLQTIQHGLALARGRRAHCINCMLGQQVVSNTQRIPVITHFSWTVNAYSFGLERTIWLGFEAELAIQRNHFFIHLRLVSVCHPKRYCSIASWFHKLRGGPRLIITERVSVNHPYKKLVVLKGICVNSLL